MIMGHAISARDLDLRLPHISRLPLALFPWLLCFPGSARCLMYVGVIEPGSIVGVKSCGSSVAPAKHYVNENENRSVDISPPFSSVCLKGIHLEVFSNIYASLVTHGQR